MSSAKITTLLDGVPRFLRALELTNASTKQRTKQAVRRGTNAVRDAAHGRVAKRSGELAYSIRSEFAKDEMTGFVKAGYGKLLRRSRATTEKGRKGFEARRQRDEEGALQFRLAPTSKKAQQFATIGQYAPVVEHGDPRRNKPAKPYLKPSLYAEKPQIIAELQQAPIAAARASGMAS